MGQQSPFEFAGIYYFYNDLIIPSGMKYHVYVGSLYELGEFEYYFFYINSESRKGYAPHHPIYKGRPPKKYNFLKEDSFIGCKNIFPFAPLSGKYTRKCILHHDDIKSVIEAYRNTPTANREIVQSMQDNFAYLYG